MLYQEIVTLIGEVPPGFEPLVYVVCCIVFLWFLQFFSTVLWSLINWLKGV